MIEIKQLHLDIQNLSQDELTIYSAFLPIQFQGYLAIKHPCNIVIIALENQMPIGLVIATILPAFRLANVHWISVLEKHRQKQIGSLLLAETQKIFIQKGCIAAEFIYPKNTQETPFLEKILLRQGWQGPRLFIERYHFDLSLFNPPWFSKDYKISPDIISFPWLNLSPKDRQLLEADFEQGRIPDFVSPFVDESLVEPLNSLGLRNKLEVIGWIITHRLTADSIRYTGLYIKNPFLFTESWIWLLSQAINLHRNSPVRWGFFEIDTRQIDKSWHTFVKKRLAPFAQYTTQDYQAWISLPNNKL